VIAAVVLALAAGDARAIGVCEGAWFVHYDPPELFDEATQSFAIPASVDWCDEGDFMNDPINWPQRGVVHFVELRDIHDAVLGRLSTVTGADADHLRKIAAFEAVRYGKLHATLLARGYAPLAGKLGKCSLATAWTDLDHQAWRGATLQLDVMRGNTRIARVRVGAGSIERRGDQSIRAHVLARQSAIDVLAIVPSCTGPPPGHFGPDDGGSCYHVDTPAALRLDAKTTPALAACF
jgi:hypothetical protein